MSVDTYTEEDEPDVLPEVLSPAASFRRETAKVGQRAERAALAALALKSLSPEARVEYIAALVAGGCDLVTVLADLFVSHVLLTFPVGIRRPATDEARLSATVLSVLRADPDPGPRIARLAVTEIASAARAASSTAMQAHRVQRYGWQLGPDP